MVGFVRCTELELQFPVSVLQFSPLRKVSLVLFVLPSPQKEESRASAACSEKPEKIHMWSSPCAKIKIRKKSSVVCMLFCVHASEARMRFCPHFYVLSCIPVWECSWTRSSIRTSKEEMLRWVRANERERILANSGASRSESLCDARVHAPIFV